MTTRKTTSILLIILFTSLVLYSCRKDDGPAVGPRKDKWVSYKVADSSGNLYFVAATFDSKLQVRVKSPDGKIIFSEYCPTVDSEELPVSSSTVSVALTPPNKYINKNDASLSVLLRKNNYPNVRPYVQLLANISLGTKAFYTKEYKVEQAHDWAFVMFHNGVAQWYQNSIIVREGTDFDLTNGGFMWLGTPGKAIGML